MIFYCSHQKHQTILHPDTIAYAAESIKEKKTEKELAKKFEQAVSELGQVDYFDETDSGSGSM